MVNGVNVALNKNVVASSVMAGFSVASSVDGTNSTFYHCNTVSNCW